MRGRHSRGAKRLLGALVAVAALLVASTTSAKPRLYVNANTTSRAMASSHVALGWQGFTPAWEPGLAAWYGADKGVSTSAGIVTSWADQSGQANSTTNQLSLVTSATTVWGSATANTALSVYVSVAGGSQSLVVNGGTAVTATNTGISLSNSNPMTVGTKYYSQSTSCFNGNLGLVVVTAAVPSVDQIWRLSTYTKNRWGI